MKCIYCGCEDSKVLDSRSTEETNSIRRRRECLNCGKRFTTYETIETVPILVVKKDGSRQAFNIEKIRNGKVYKLRRKIGIVFQDFKLLPKLTVYENVAFALKCVGMKAKEIRPRVMSALERVGLKDKVRSFPGELSGGEQQRVCIARAIVNRPKLLICDEPTGNLDPDTSKEIMKVIEGINKDLGTTIIMATHDRDIVNRMKKRVLLIEHGILAGDYAKGSYKTHEGS